MTHLAARLEQLGAALAAAGDPLAGLLAAPLDPGAVDADERLPGPVPDEVRTWFAWHDGLVAGRDADYELVPGGVPVSLDEAATLAGEWAAVARQVAESSGLDAGTLWDPRWLPLLANMAGDLLVVVCDAEHRDASPLHYRMAETGETELAYDNLTALAATAAACWQSDVYRRAGQGLVGGDPSAITGIWERHNPVAASAHGGVAPRGVVSGEEPPPDQEVQGLLEGLRAPAPAERLRAVVVLARLGHAAALQPGLELLGDTTAAVRWTAAEALGELADPAAAPGLAAALGDPVAEVRWTAADALAKLGEAAPAGARAALAAAARDDADSTVRQAAAEALERVGRS